MKIMFSFHTDHLRSSIEQDLMQRRDHAANARLRRSLRRRARRVADDVDD